MTTKELHEIYRRISTLVARILMNDFDPMAPTQAMVRAARSVAEITSQLKAIRGRMGTRDRQNIEDAVSAGEFLNEMKPQVDHGKWGAKLEEIGFSSSYASRLMRLAKSDLSRISECSTVTEAMELVKDEPDADLPPGTNSAPSQTAPSETKPQCPACSRVKRLGGTPPRKCKDCDALEEKPHTGSGTTKREREPGSTNPPKPPAKNVTVDFDLWDGGIKATTKQLVNIGKVYQAKGEVLAQVEVARSALNTHIEAVDKIKELLS